MAIGDQYIDKLKKFEGFYSKPYWDYKQWTVGYGTRASGPNDVVDQEEAKRRLARELEQAANLVDRFAPNLDQGTRAALTSLTFNAGADWMSGGLGDAVKRGDMDDAKRRFVQYTKAGGEHLPGLATRRNAEVAWFGQGSGNPNVAMNGGSAGVSPTGSAGIAGAIQTGDPLKAEIPTQFADLRPSQTPSPVGGGDDGYPSGLLAGLFGSPNNDSGQTPFSSLMAQAQAPAIPQAEPMQAASAYPRPVDVASLLSILQQRSKLGTA